MTKEEEMALRELAAKPHYISKVSEALGPLSLWSKSGMETEIRKAVEAEREACAKVCDDKVDAEYATGKVDHNEMGWTQSCAIAIRARGEA